ncbi:collagen alpha-1(I) chain-like [Lontra canadensis]|uniref:collagen alpha-1(I) chain-like n=1 Tax=Lontra canadensis TaxID=76717 RepID=UPI0013F32392|nr:collagen alpha-1(I) chain-like [Lontra canadensis]
MVGGGGASALQGRGQEKSPPTPAGLRVGNQRGSGGLGAPRPQVTRAPGDRGDAGPVPACEPKSEGSEGAGIPSAHARDPPGSAQSGICSVQSRSAGSGLRRGLPALPGVSGHHWAPGARSTRTQKVRTPAPAAPERPRESAQPGPAVRRGREGSHLSVCGRKGPETAGSGGRGGGGRGDRVPAGPGRERARQGARRGWVRRPGRGRERRRAEQRRRGEREEEEARRREGRGGGARGGPGPGPGARGSQPRLRSRRPPGPLPLRSPPRQPPGAGSLPVGQTRAGSGLGLPPLPRPALPRRGSTGLGPLPERRAAKPPAPRPSPARPADPRRTGRPGGRWLPQRPPGSLGSARSALSEKGPALRAGRELLKRHTRRPAPSAERASRGTLL